MSLFIPLLPAPAPSHKDKRLLFLAKLDFFSEAKLAQRKVMIDLAEFFNNRFFGVETLIIKIGGGEEEKFLLKIQKNLLFENLEPYLIHLPQVVGCQKRPKSAFAMMKEREKSIERDEKERGWRKEGGGGKIKRKGRREGERTISKAEGSKREKEEEEEEENNKGKEEKVAQEKGFRKELELGNRDQGKRRVGVGSGRSEEGGRGEKGGVARQSEKNEGIGGTCIWRERSQNKEGSSYDEVRDILLKIKRNLK